MQLHTHESNGIYVISPNGRIMTDQDTAEFKDTVRDAMTSGRRKVVADLGGVDWMNSTGIGALINGYTMLKEADGDFRLANVNESVFNVLKINKLNLVFDIHPTLDEALQALA
jgi:anti-sigma B factor antagonist